MLVPSPYKTLTALATILITGASGLIGTALSKALVAQGHVLHHLGRSSAGDTNRVKHFRWDIPSGTIDERCLHGVTQIVHLAGAGIADRRWSEARVKELIDSRAASARLLLRAVRDVNLPLETIVSAAGINYYGAYTSDHVFAETDAAGSDTIAHISVVWEAAVDEWKDVARVVKLRTPLVLANNGGGLSKLAAPVRLGLGAALGNGEQWMPWVHIADLVRIYQHALTSTRMAGAYNVNTGQDVTNDTFMRTISRVLGKPYFLPRVPGVALKLALGELSSILLHGSRASNEHLLATGFTFTHPELDGALRHLLH